jgi:hypothetical protein
MALCIALIMVPAHASPITECPGASESKETTMSVDENGSELRIRMLEDRDAAAIRRVAERDSDGVPPLPLLGAEVAGRLVAAVPLDGAEERAIADPFVPTAAVLAVLRMRARQLCGLEASERGGQPCSSGAIVRPAEASCSQ